MAITLEILDTSHEDQDSTIIVGENILLKFIPANSASTLSKHPELKNIINIDNLLLDDKLKWIKEIIRLTDSFKLSLGDYIKKWNNSNKIYETSDLSNISNSIIEIERLINISLCNTHYHSFCAKCGAYIGEQDNLITKCPKCSIELKESDKIGFTYLDKDTSVYFNGGIWFEDYMERILLTQGWKIWTHGNVMGASGIAHQIDILAIKEDKILIAECKTGHINTRDISHFIVQKIDIPSHFGLFLSLQDCSSKSTASLFKVSTSSLIDNIEKMNDSEIVEKINNHIQKFEKK